MTLASPRLPRARANRLALALRRMRAAGRAPIDLTVSNPTAVGLQADEQALRAALDCAGVARYEPAALGLASAREAIARELDGAVDPSRLMICACSSEAYGLLFKLLCAPGERVLVPRPSYPLFEQLTALEGVEAVPYRLLFDGRWRLDLAQLERAIDGRTRAVLVVNPNNPTGSFVGAEQLEQLTRLCAGRGVALIADEVFGVYAMSGAAPTSFLGQQGPLTFVIDGLSKRVGLPQLKLSWVAVGGPARQSQQAVEQLEVIADAYLSLATAVQLALPRLFELGVTLRQRIQRRIVDNHQALGRLVARHPACTVLPVEAGWTAIVRVPALRSEEQLALTLLEREGVLVHPGYFFDLEQGAHLVVSLLCPPAPFVEGMGRVFGVAGDASC